MKEPYNTATDSKMKEPYNTATDSKKFRFILSDIRFLHKINNLSIVVHALPMSTLSSFSVDEILLPRYMN